MQPLSLESLSRTLDHHFDHEDVAEFDVECRESRGEGIGVKMQIQQLPNVDRLRDWGWVLHTVVFPHDNRSLEGLYPVNVVACEVVTFESANGPPCLECDFYSLEVDGWGSFMVDSVFHF